MDFVYKTSTLFVLCEPGTQQNFHTSSLIEGTNVSYECGKLSFCFFMMGRVLNITISFHVYLCEQRLGRSRIADSGHLDTLAFIPINRGIQSVPPNLT